MPIVVIVIASSATNFGRIAVEQRDNRMIGDAAALHAVIVNNVAQSLFTHDTSAIPEYSKMPHSRAACRMKQSYRKH